MHGQGYAPPPPQPPSSGAQAGLRVLFVAIAVLTIGFLAFVPTLKLAVTSRRRVDWQVFSAVAAFQLLSWVLVFTDPGDEEFVAQGNAGMVVMLLTLAVSVTYFLVADIRLAAQQRLAARPATGPFLPGPQPQPPYGYGRPQPQAPVYPQPGPAAHLTQGTTAPRTTPVPPSTPPSTPPGPPAQGQPPHRIDQVRAELDELSDYLRRQDGGR
ncbi:hypothetical protein GTW43_30205 [Streptomyces sp. SID5785]|uniref:hypothetical protein n=1 Tax=Streptomyces sp. SID5785 TaxID=2690309 RepID=UPI001361F36C|nr:hypothetical protein [Streptomyces sp. SID5785]MZD09322.1 hypothetical protein [Streptomyces sp. SID5785]